MHNKANPFDQLKDMVPVGNKCEDLKLQVKLAHGASHLVVLMGLFTVATEFGLVFKLLSAVI